MFPVNCGFYFKVLLKPLATGGLIGGLTIGICGGEEAFFGTSTFLEGFLSFGGFFFGSLIRIGSSLGLKSRNYCRENLF